MYTKEPLEVEEGLTVFSVNALEKPLDPAKGQKESILRPFSLVTAKPPQERRHETTTYLPLITSMSTVENSNDGKSSKGLSKLFGFIVRTFLKHFMQLANPCGSRKKQMFGTPVTDLGQSCKN